MPFERLGAVSYSSSIVSMAVSLAISDYSASKNDLTFKSGFGLSRSLKMVRFDRPYMTFYSAAIVTIALSCTVLELLNVE